MFCNLEVDVNGQETFSVSMKHLAFFSGKLRTLFSKLAAGKTGSLKLILHDFPGGAEGFELIVRFCYNGGRIDITPSNVFLLHSAAKFLEINEDQTKKYFESIHLWTWSELLHCLKQCQELLPFTNSSFMVQEILDALVEKISMPNISSPFAFSCSENCSMQFSGDISTNSSRSSSFQTSNWLRDLDFLSIGLFEKVVNTMISHKLDRGIISSFLLHYQKVKFVSLLPAEKCKIIEVVISPLCSLDGSFNFPFRSLCDMLQACFALKLEKYCAKSLERMIGSRLDEATLDDLLVPSPSKNMCAYDVNLIMRFLKIFLGKKSRRMFFVQRLQKVGCLMDLYLAEVAPDPHLKPRKFLALASGLPDTARESYDRVYEAMGLYFKIHNFISEEEKKKICTVLNYDKLSSESLVNLARNAEFPACAAAAVVVFLQSKLKTPSKNVKDLAFRCDSSLSANEGEQLLVHFSKRKECRKVQKKSKNVARTNVTCPTNGKSLLRLCS